MVYYKFAHRMFVKGGKLKPLIERGWMPMTTFEAISLMLEFGMLIIAILSFDKGQKK